MENISTVYARVLARELVEQGIEAADLFANTGLDQKTLWTTNEVSATSFTTLLENSERLYSAEPIGFLIGRYQNTLALGAMGAAMGYAPTVGDGLRLAETYTRLHASYIDICLTVGINSASINVHFNGSLGETLKHHVEAVFLTLQAYVETLAGRCLSDACFNASYQQPVYHAVYAERLHGKTKFSQPHNLIELPKQFLKVASPYANLDLWSQSTRQLNQQLTQQIDLQADAMSRHILALLRSVEPPLPSLADLAEQIHISPRTLNRRLQMEHTNFRSLRNQIMHDWAKDYLRDTSNSVESIAAILGYQDVANFRRGFKQQAGMPPKQYRQLHGDGFQGETALEVRSRKPSA